MRSYLDFEKPVAELEALVEGLRRDPLPTILLSPPSSGLTGCREVMAEVGARLRGPVGLSIGSRTPPEIALSILADLIASRNGIVLERAARSERRQRA